MKKILSLLLALTLAFTAVLLLASCNNNDNGDDNSNTDNNTNDDATPKTIYELFAEMKPTKTVTFVTYTPASDGEEVKPLKGKYTMETEGDDSIFEFSYDKYRTTEEAIQDGDSSRIKTVTGKVYCKDGKYSGDGVLWGASPVATDIKVKMDTTLFKVSTLSKDGRTLTALVTPENAAAVFGTDLATSGDVTLKLISNGTYITGLNVTYSTVEGAMVEINTSYSYNVITLEFPDSVYQ